MMIALFKLGKALFFFALGIGVRFIFSQRLRLITFTFGYSAVVPIEGIGKKTWAEYLTASFLPGRSTNLPASQLVPPQLARDQLSRSRLPVNFCAFLKYEDSSEQAFFAPIEVYPYRSATKDRQPERTRYS